MLFVYGQSIRRATDVFKAKNISFNKSTGEIVEGKDLSLDKEKIAEDSFKITKSEFST